MSYLTSTSSANIPTKPPTPGLQFLDFSQASFTPSERAYQVNIASATKRSCVRAEIYTTNRILTSVIDTGSGISLISRREWALHFPTTAVHRIPNNVSIIINGVHEGELRTREFCMLPISFRTLQKHDISITSEVHVVDRLPASLIIRTNILQPNRVNIIWNSPEGTPALHIDGTYIAISTEPPKATRAAPVGPKVRIRAIGRYIVKAGTGHNIPVKFSRPLMPQTSYLIYPIRRPSNLPLGTLGGVLSAVIQATENVLPFSNFGTRDILVRDSEELATASPYNEPAKRDAAFCLLMEAIFEGIPQTFNEVDTTDLPFDIQPPEDMVDIS